MAIAGASTTRNVWQIEKCLMFACNGTHRRDFQSPTAFDHGHDRGFFKIAHDLLNLADRAPYPATRAKIVWMHWGRAAKTLPR